MTLDDIRENQIAIVYRSPDGKVLARKIIDCPEDQELMRHAFKRGLRELDRSIQEDSRSE